MWFLKIRCISALRKGNGEKERVLLCYTKTFFFQNTKNKKLEHQKQSNKIKIALNKEYIAGLSTSNVFIKSQ